MHYLERTRGAYNVVWWTLTLYQCTLQLIACSIIMTGIILPYVLKHFIIISEVRMEITWPPSNKSDYATLLSYK